MQSQAHVHHDQVFYGLVGVVTTLHAEKMLTAQGQESVVVCMNVYIHLIKGSLKTPEYCQFRIERF